MVFFLSLSLLAARGQSFDLLCAYSPIGIERTIPLRKLQRPFSRIGTAKTSNFEHRTTHKLFLLGTIAPEPTPGIKAEWKKGNSLHTLMQIAERPGGLKRADVRSNKDASSGGVATSR